LDWHRKPWEDLGDREESLNYLAELLVNGELSLLLGAGVSKPMGLPLWKDLVRACYTHSGLPGPGDTDYTGSQDLLKAIDELELLGGDVDRVLKLALYGGLFGAPADGLPLRYPVEASENAMLSAIGALVMSSSRGSTAEILTLNFDDLLEWYLDLHGYTSQIVAEMPVLVRDWVDVRLFHLHGFLPLTPKYEPSKGKILSNKEVRKRNSQEDSSAWKSFLINRLHSKIFLVIGTGLEDEDIHLPRLKVETEIGKSRPFGFVVDVLSEKTKKRLLSEGFIPVGLPNYDAVPGYLLEICQRAASLRSAG
jgi:SIR2-like domain